MFDSVIDTIGNTPLIRMKKASDLTGCEIYGKAEFLNPGQSVKDRAALYIIRDAEKRGLLRPGGVIVEGTAGNTGIGLTMVAKSLGLPYCHRYSRNPEPGKEGCLPASRCRAGGSARRSLQKSEQLCEGLRASCGADGKKRAEWRHLGEPV